MSHNKTDTSSAASNTSNAGGDTKRKDVVETSVTQDGGYVCDSNAQCQRVAGERSNISNGGGDGGDTDWKTCGESAAKRKKLGRPTGSGLSRDSGEGRQSGVSDVDDWPECVGDEVRERVENWEMPHGYKKKDRPDNASSLVWYAGVRVVHEEANVEGWICLASKECAEKNDVQCWTGAMSNWTRHLETFHKLRSNRAVQVQADEGEPAEKLVAGAKCNGSLETDYCSSR